MINITIIIIIITTITSLIMFADRGLFNKLSYSPYMVYHGNQWYRLGSHAFIHADWMHLLVNMYVLYNFGPVAEEFFFYYFGAKGMVIFTFLYLGGIFFSAIPAYKKHRDNIHYNAVGASGAVSAVLFSSIIFMPVSTLQIMFIPIDIPAFIFGILYLIFEAYMNKKSQTNIAHDAHFFGALFGAMFTILLKPLIFLNFVNQIKEYFTNL